VSAEAARKEADRLRKRKQRAEARKLLNAQEGRTEAPKPKRGPGRPRKDASTTPAADSKDLSTVDLSELPTEFLDYLWAMSYQVPVGVIVMFTGDKAKGVPRIEPGKYADPAMQALGAKLFRQWVESKGYRIPVHVALGVVWLGSVATPVSLAFAGRALEMRGVRIDPRNFGEAMEELRKKADGPPPEDKPAAPEVVNGVVQPKPADSPVRGDSQTPSA
jgi:hypothetical protein